MNKGKSCCPETLLSPVTKVTDLPRPIPLTLIQFQCPPRAAQVLTKSLEPPSPLNASLTPGSFREHGRKSSGGSQEEAALPPPAPRLSEAGLALGILSVSLSLCLPEPKWRAQALRVSQGLRLQDPGTLLSEAGSRGSPEHPQILSTSGPSKACPLRS